MYAFTDRSLYSFFAFINGQRNSFVEREKSVKYVLYVSINILKSYYKAIARILKTLWFFIKAACKQTNVNESELQ